MMQNQRPPIRRIAFPILIALSISHCLNDMMQSVISAVYPLFKEDLFFELCSDWSDYTGLSNVGICVSAFDGIAF